MLETSSAAFRLIFAVHSVYARVYRQSQPRAVCAHYFRNYDIPRDTRISRWKNRPGGSRGATPVGGESAAASRREGRKNELSYTELSVVVSTAGACARYFRRRRRRRARSNLSGFRCRRRASRSRKTLQPPLIASSVATLSAIFFKLSPDTRRATAARHTPEKRRFLSGKAPTSHPLLPPPHPRSNRRACRTRLNAAPEFRARLNFKGPPGRNKGEGGRGRARRESSGALPIPATSGGD